MRTGNKARAREERDRKHGNAAWAPCKACSAYGKVDGEVCRTCEGIGFVQRRTLPFAANSPSEKS